MPAPIQNRTAAPKASDGAKAPAPAVAPANKVDSKGKADSKPTSPLDVQSKSTFEPSPRRLLDLSGNGFDRPSASSQTPSSASPATTSRPASASDVTSTSPAVSGAAATPVVREEVDVRPRTFGVDRPGFTAPEAPSSIEARTDGLLQGADGRVFKPAKGLGIDGIPPVRPEGAGAQDGRPPVLSVFGVGTDAAGANSNSQALANATGRDVVSVRNATEGPLALGDFVEVAGQKIRGDHPPATRTTADVITDRLTQEQPLEIHAHSQGALITSQAIGSARDTLVREHGLTPEQANQRLGLLDVHTYGGASHNYPDGPKYTHHVNRLDPVSAVSGVGNSSVDPVSLLSNPGEGATVDRQTRPSLNPHSFKNYLDWVYPKGASTPAEAPIPALKPDVSRADGSGGRPSLSSELEAFGGPGPDVGVSFRLPALKPDVSRADGSGGRPSLSSELEAFGGPGPDVGVSFRLPVFKPDVSGSSGSQPSGSSDLDAFGGPGPDIGTSFVLPAFKPDVSGSGSLPSPSSDLDAFGGAGPDIGLSSIPIPVFKPDVSSGLTSGLSSIGASDLDAFGGAGPAVGPSFGGLF